MLSEIVVASLLLVCMACFFSVNLHNTRRGRRREVEIQRGAEVRRPPRLSTAMVAVLAMVVAGTLLYFAAAFAYVGLVFSGSESWLYGVRLPIAAYVQVPGLILSAAGYGIFIWSVVARGRYAVSWAMPEDHRLVTWGPYAYVRHPSYLAYFLMFAGVFLLWPTVFTILPWVAIPGYIGATFEEEKLLVQRFGADYLEYQRKAGRFLPRIR